MAKFSLEASQGFGWAVPASLACSHRWHQVGQAGCSAPRSRSAGTWATQLCLVQVSKCQLLACCWVCFPSKPVTWELQALCPPEQLGGSKSHEKGCGMLQGREMQKGLVSCFMACTFQPHFTPSTVSLLLQVQTPLLLSFDFTFKKPVESLIG